MFRFLVPFFVIIPVLTARAQDDAITGPDRVFLSISAYNEQPDEYLGWNVGSIIGHLAAVFRLHPERRDDWLEQISNERLANFAVIALGLAGDLDGAEAYAIERSIASESLISILAHSSGAQFPPAQEAWKDRPIKETLAPMGTLDDMHQQMGWHQDVLWSAAITEGDGAVTVQILETMDELFSKLGIEPAGQPVAKTVRTPEFREMIQDLQSTYGEQAYARIYAYLYLAAGGWSFASNYEEYDFVAVAFNAYAKAHPDSPAVKDVRLNISMAEGN